MENKKELMCIGIAILVIGFIAMQGYAEETSTQSTASNVTISSYVAIGLSGNLTKGILFGDLDPHTNNNNGTANYDGTNTTTTYWIEVSSDGNMDVDLCIKYDGPLNTSDGDEIGQGNYTWADNRTSNTTYMSPSNDYPVPSAFQKTNVSDISTGSNDYFRFWLSVPAGQSPGTYNNTMYFKGIINGSSC